MRHIIDLIANTIKGTKFESNVYIAGGFVRDKIITGKEESKDLDLCVNLRNINAGMELAEFLQSKLDCSKVVTFPKFGTAKITINEIDVEMVATRSEKYNLKSRNPEVSSASLYEDVVRRDFTINSLMINISTGELIDYLNGKQDIYDKIIKTTSDPDIIFQEDALRMLRAIRFASRLGFSIEQSTYNSIIKNTRKLYTISRERIRDEFIKILESENVLSGLKYLYSTGILAYMIPEFKKVCKITNMGIHHKHIKDLWNHTLTVVNNSKPTWQHRLAGLLHDIGKVSTMTKQGDNVHFFGHQKVSEKITKRFMNSYKFKIKDIELVSLGVLFHMSVYESFSEKTIRKYVDIYGRNEFLFCLDVCEADVSYRNTTRLKFVNDLREFVVNDEFFKKEEKVKPLINGDELMVLFNLKPSKKVGTLIAIQIERLYENPNITREEMLEIIKIGGKMTKYTKCLKCGRIYDDQAIIFSERDKETGVETYFCECGNDLDDSIEFIVCPFCENHATVYKPCLCDNQFKALQGWNLPLDKLSELGFDVEGIQGNVANLYATPDYKFKMSYLNGEVEYPESETDEIISMLREGGLL